MLPPGTYNYNVYVRKLFKTEMESTLQKCLYEICKQCSQLFPTKESDRAFTETAFFIN